jgi:hypothetical protein
MFISQQRENIFFLFYTLLILLLTLADEFLENCTVYKVRVYRQSPGRRTLLSCALKGI